MSKNGPKVLVLDIENSYILAGAWGLWNQNIGLNQIMDYGKVICYAFKWLDGTRITFKKHTDEDFLDCIHEAMDEADAILTFNGRKHDIPMLNREFLKARLNPPSPYKHIDLYETVKQQFKFPSNKMGHILNELEAKYQKQSNEGFPLWVKCLQGNKQAWRDMKEYNIGDVQGLEEMYWELLPWIRNHPNHNLYGSVGACPTCGGSHLQRRGFHRNGTTKYQRFQCMDCGKWSRTRFTEITPEERHAVLTGAD